VTAIADRLAAVRERITAACSRSGRTPECVRIVAVTKTQPAATVDAVIAAGVDAIGENRVQEAADKRPAVVGHLPWHLIGPLQRNKAKLALALFDVVETIDRPELADRLEMLLASGDRRLPVFLEVNTGGEPQKYGADPDGTPRLAEHVLRHCPHLHLAGLMTVPPWHADPERARPYFATLRELAAALAGRFGLRGLELSMGMSDDFDVAIEEGATIVRLGRVLVGTRAL
jgi:PLP dependent protein